MESVTLVVVVIVAGCAANSLGSQKAGGDDKPTRPVSTIPARACIEITHSITPDMLSNQSRVPKAVEAVKSFLYGDWTQSGIFTTISTKSQDADVLVSIRSQWGPKAVYSVDCFILNPQTKEAVLSYHREKKCRIGREELRDLVKDLHGEIRAEMSTDFKKKDLSKLGGNFVIGSNSPASNASSPLSTNVPFEDLLVAKEASISLARQRNRVLVACKTLTLPQLLREKKTAELAALTVKIEQVILDLNHESEMEKDRAQRAAEQDPQAVEDHRELAVVYKERIEVLKPINAAIKEEIANRTK